MQLQDMNQSWIRCLQRRRRRPRQKHLRYLLLRLKQQPRRQVQLRRLREQSIHLICFESPAATCTASSSMSTRIFLSWVQTVKSAFALPLESNVVNYVSMSAWFSFSWPSFVKHTLFIRLIVIGKPLKTTSSFTFSFHVLMEHVVRNRGHPIKNLLSLWYR